MIRVNGTEEAYSEEMTVMEYVSAKGYRTNRIAVERNGQIVPKNAYESTVIKDGDSLEVVSFVGGG
ncbi:MAG: sulfur carrier protein ThiS [Mediterraneibacter sp.]